MLVRQIRSKPVSYFSLQVSNQEAVDIVRSLCVGVDKPEAFSACKKLVDLALARGSLDDISIMIIQLTQFIQ